MQCAVSIARSLGSVLLLLVIGCAPQTAGPGDTAAHVAGIGNHEQARTAPEPGTIAVQSAQTAPDAKANIEKPPGAKIATGATAMAVTANPHATQVAQAVLRSGGSAIDAAIAAQMVLGLVEPQSSGIGGGGFLLYWDADSRRLHSYDGRETAPSAASESLFVNPADGGRMAFGQALIGGRSVGVPGLLRMLAMAHKAHGAQPWQQLFEPAIALAQSGFSVSPRLASLVANVPALKVRPAIRAYLHPGGQALLAGETLSNKAYARSLETIASQGANAMYRGPLADAFVAAVNSDPNPGALSAEDMWQYRAVRREPVCRMAFEHRVCSMGPPSSGATTVLAILGTLEALQDNANASQASPRASGESIAANAQRAHQFIESSRLAFADRNYYVGDTDFVDVPIEGLLNPAYLASRAKLVRPQQRLANIKQGEPAGAAPRAMAEPLELASTTHLVIVDAAGNIASMTTSIESAFGSRLMVDGYILNNQLTDFSFLPRDANQHLLANRVQGGKRPLSSMSPVIVFNLQGEPVLALGSPGGKSIIGFVARVLYETLAQSRALADAVAAPHIIDTGKKLYLEPAVSEPVQQALRAKGHKPVMRAQTSGISAVQRSADGWLGVADPRREGSAAGY